MPCPQCVPWGHGFSLTLTKRRPGSETTDCTNCTDKMRLMSFVQSVQSVRFVVLSKCREILSQVFRRPMDCEKAIIHRTACAVPLPFLAAPLDQGKTFPTLFAPRLGQKKSATPFSTSVYAWSYCPDHVRRRHIPGIHFPALIWPRGYHSPIFLPILAPVSINAGFFRLWRASPEPGKLIPGMIVSRARREIHAPTGTRRGSDWVSCEGTKA